MRKPQKLEKITRKPDPKHTEEWARVLSECIEIHPDYDLVLKYFPEDFLFKGIKYYPKGNIFIVDNIINNYSILEPQRQNLYLIIGIVGLFFQGGEEFFNLLENSKKEYLSGVLSLRKMLESIKNPSNEVRKISFNVSDGLNSKIFERDPSITHPALINEITVAIEKILNEKGFSDNYVRGGGQKKHLKEYVVSKEQPKTKRGKSIAKDINNFLSENTVLNQRQRCITIGKMLAGLEVIYDSFNTLYSIDNEAGIADLVKNWLKPS